MLRALIYSRVKELLHHLNVPFANDDDELKSCGLDSYKYLELLATLIKEFEIDFDGTDMSFYDLRTVSDITDLINSKASVKEG